MYSKGRAALSRNVSSGLSRPGFNRSHRQNTSSSAIPPPSCLIAPSTEVYAWILTSSCAFAFNLQLTIHRHQQQPATKCPLLTFTINPSLDATDNAKAERAIATKQNPSIPPIWKTQTFGRDFRNFSSAFGFISFPRIQMKTEPPTPLSSPSSGWLAGCLCSRYRTLYIKRNLIRAPTKRSEFFASCQMT